MNIGHRISGSTLIALLAASAGSGALLALTGPGLSRPVDLEGHVCELPKADAGAEQVEELRREIQILRRALGSAQARGSATALEEPAAARLAGAASSS